MENTLKKSVFLFLTFLFLVITVNAQKTYPANYKGKLVVGKLNSVIIYYGNQSGDLAAFCFPNKSTVGRAILAKCKNDQMCGFRGKIRLVSDFCDTAYKYTSRFKLGNFSETAEIVSINSVRLITGN